jgi:hypothetical protein
VQRPRRQDGPLGQALARWGAKRMAVTRTHFTFRIDMWDRDGLGVIEHIAGAQDYQVAIATYRAACQRWPDAFITLRQGARVIEESRKMRLA